MNHKIFAMPRVFSFYINYLYAGAVLTT